MPGEFEESEAIFELGFSKDQKKGLSSLISLSSKLKELNLYDLEKDTNK